MHVWNVLHAAPWKYRTEKVDKSRHLGTIAQLCRAISSQLRQSDNRTNLSSQYGKLRPVELAALHAATKNMINPTARTGGPYAGGGRPVPFPPHTADVAFRVELRRSALGGHTAKSPVVVVDESRIYAAWKICLKGLISCRLRTWVNCVRSVMTVVGE